MLEILINHGLVKLGKWIKSDHATTAHLRDECFSGINYDLATDWRTKRNVIYAFVVNSQVRYIGETTTGMASRFNNYRYGNQLVTDTDNRIKLDVTKILENGDEVEIWAAQPLAQMVFPNGCTLEIPASKPLEEYLIQKLNPELNVRNIG